MQALIDGIHISPDSLGSLQPAGTPPAPVLSVVVPAYNEQENIPLLHRRLCEVLDRTMSWEVVFVDDGSRDKTWQVISALAAQGRTTRGVRLSRNFGHQYALLAGLQSAAGQAVITMDCDLQHPVELIPVLLERWRAGFKVVKTVRQDDCHVGWFKRLSSHLFYWLFSFLSGVKLQPGLADFRLLDRKVLVELLRFNEAGLFLRGLTEWIGFSSCVIPYQPAQRACGSSRYTVYKMLSLAWKGVSSFSIMPLRIGLLVGFAGSLLSIGTILYAFFGKFLGSGTVPGWASTLLVISVLFLLLFIYLGILGEYIGRVVVEVRQRPRFIVCETAGEPGFKTLT